MIRRAFPVTVLLLITLTACQGAADTDTNGDSKPAGGASADETGTPLADAVKQIPTAPERRTGYDRDKFRIWIDADHDGCDTRAEVLIATAIEPPDQGADCKLSGGKWLSYYDDTTVTDARELDIDHVVPLAEAWDSGASAWSAGRREQYANDLDGRRSLLAVTAHANRSKGDRDPAEWMPPAEDAQCQYVADWTAMKLRWGLTADSKEHTALLNVARNCSDTEVSYTSAPSDS